MTPDVKADAAAQMRHEVIGAVVTLGARHALLVDARIASADAGHQVEANSLPQMRLVEEVEVGQDGAIVQSGPGPVDVLSGQPSGFDVNAEALEGDHVTAEVKISAAAHRRVRTAGSGGRLERAAAEKDVTLLGGGKLGEGQEREKGCDQS